MRRLFWIAVAVLLVALASLPGAVASAKDAAGSKDHPLVGRYAGSEIVFYDAKAFDAASLLKAPLDNAAVTAAMAGNDTGASWMRAEGRVTRIRYDEPSGRSSLEILANLRDALLAKGFQPVFACEDATCFSGSQNDAYLLGWAVDGAQQNFRYAGHARYLLARLSRPAGDVDVALLVGEANGTATAFVTVVEAKPMDTGKVVFVDSGAMAKALQGTGRVALYGIHFDFDKDVPLPDSRRTLDEIAKLLRAEPDLKLVVTGHTDNRGDFAYNVELSRRRAASIVADLTGHYGIAAARLIAFGAGMAAPIASNADETGRAKNRRVELVAR